MELRLDVDGKQKGSKRIKKVIELLGLKVRYWEIYKTNNGWHHYIGVDNKLTDLEVVLVQALMGSDFKRECFNYLRVKSGKFSYDDWNVLFKRKYEVDLVNGDVKLVSREIKVGVKL
ncbi:MAG: hypothetical protein DRN12_05295 [Thermoplasmata archaeon]|nr:MAG: hypothetical protein DRN12_05295 [Thermoplasmata archaeon]